MKSVFCSTLFIGSALVASAAAPRPNMIVILMDDFGYNDLGVQTYPDTTNYYPNAGPTPKLNISSPDPDIPEPNHARLLTPRLDTLAASGLRMTSFHSSNKCSPSRGSLMTGRYDRRININSVFFPTQNNGINTKEVTLPEVLREQGYSTAMIDKWHLGYSVSAANPMQLMPRRHGFEEFYGVPHSNDMTDFCLVENEAVIDNDFSSATEQAQLVWRYTEKALDFIQRKSASKKPFFLYLANSMPHIPVYPSDREFTNADGTTWPKFQGTSGVSWYYDIIKEVDHSVGRILDKLDSLGIADDTIIMFTSDNGPWVRLSNINLQARSVGCAYPLRDSKSTTWEGGCRVPFLVSWPGHIPAGSVSGEVAGLIDIMPTLVGLAGGTMPSDRVIDGIDLWPHWSAQSGWTSPRSSYALFSGSGTLDSVQKGDWKLRLGSLYNLADDIQEQVNEAANEPVVLAELQAEISAVNSSISSDNQPMGVFTAFEVLMSTDGISVPEGGSVELGLVLSGNPGANVTVNIARFSGDTDLSVSGGAVLSFDAGNWSVTQNVSFAAAEDVDAEHGGATFRVSSPEISAVREIFALEADDEAPPAVESSLVWPTATAIMTGSNTVKLLAEGRAVFNAVTNPPGTTFLWYMVAGPGEVLFTDANAFETGISFSQDGPYRLRCVADHPDAGGFGSADFIANVGFVPDPASLLRFSPPLAYDVALDTDGDSVWQNSVQAGDHDWTLAAGVSRTTSDPAPDLDLVDAAWIFPGGAIPAGASSFHLDEYSTRNASLEIWFKPAALPVSSPRVIWESGGDIGASFTINSNVLFFAVDDGASNSPLGDVARATLSPSAEQNGFIHCVGVIDLGNDQLLLYVDGNLADTRSIPSVNDWCGTSHSGLGSIVDSNGAETANLGHLGGNDILPASCAPFAGQIAVMRFYDQALSGSQVAELLTVPEPPEYNLAPVVNAGGDHSVAYTAGAVLPGTLRDDGLPEPATLTSLWRQKAGPGVAVFADESSTNTTGSFDLPGVYTLRLEADDAEVKVYDEAVIAVAPLTYAEWAGGYAFPAGEDGERDNPDGDPLENIWEWTLGYHPLIADVTSGAGNGQIAVSNQNACFTFSFDVPRNREPVVQLNGSTNLTAWALLPGLVPQVTILDAQTVRWIFTFEADTVARPRYFVRPVVSE